MADLLSLADLKGYLPYSKPDQDGLLQAILDAIEDHLENETGQLFRPAGTVTNEARLGRGGNVLYLRRPATTITDIKVSPIGDSANPSYTIPAADVVIDPENARRVIRKQNGVFPRARLNVFNLFVTYSATEHLPGIAKEAVKEGAALVYRLRGSEHVISESLGDLGSHVLEVERRFGRLPMWDAAVAALRGSVVA